MVILPYKAFLIQVKTAQKHIKKQKENGMFRKNNAKKKISVTASLFFPIY